MQCVYRRDLVDVCMYVSDALIISQISDISLIGTKIKLSVSVKS